MNMLRNLSIIISSALKIGWIFVSRYIPYSGKAWQGKNLVNLLVLSIGKKSLVNE